MATPLDPLSRRVRVLLSSHCITTAEQLAVIHPLILLGIRGFGYKSLREVEALVRPGTRYDRLAAAGRVDANARSAKEQRHLSLMLN